MDFRHEGSRKAVWFWAPRKSSARRGREQSVGHELLIARERGKGSRRVRRDVVELYVGGQRDNLGSDGMAW